jgi:hypothetical protein
VVNFSNWQKYQANLTEGMIAVFKGDHFWSFPKEAEIVVGPTVPIGRPKLYLDNTEKYGNQTRMVRLPTGGYTVQNYTAGAPFPNPLAEKNTDLIGQEIHYDCYYRPQARTEFAPNCTTAIDRYGNMTRTSDTNVVFTQMTHLSSPTYPVELPDNGGYYRAAYIEQTAPEQGKYTATLLLSPNDPTAIDELYAYIPSLRRSLRLSEAARCAPLFGTDFTWEDLDSGPPIREEYEAACSGPSEPQGLCELRHFYRPAAGVLPQCRQADSVLSYQGVGRLGAPGCLRDRVLTAAAVRQGLLLQQAGRLRRQRDTVRACY